VPAGSWGGHWAKRLRWSSSGVLSRFPRYIYHESSGRSQKVDSDYIQMIAMLVSWSGGTGVTGLGFGLGRRGRILGGGLIRGSVRGGSQSLLRLA
jgi:hypothetical protein